MSKYHNHKPIPVFYIEETEEKVEQLIGFVDGKKDFVTRTVYVCKKDGRKMTLGEAPAGAVWNAHWLVGHFNSPDGRLLCVRLPNGNDWLIDSRANNCDSKCKLCGKEYKDPVHKSTKGPEGEWIAQVCVFEESRPHHCWVRHGNPHDGTLHVDKKGLTCGAGAGSIGSGDGDNYYHGFLHDGLLHT